jgi:hypothetical protein
VADPWGALSAIASATDTLRLGPMVTPLARGTTWVLSSMDPQPPEPEVRAVVDAGP